MCDLVCPVNHKVFYSLFFEHVSIALCFRETGIAVYTRVETSSKAVPCIL